MEADVQSYQTCSNRLILKALRSTDDHPKRAALAVDTPRCSFRRKANNLSTLLPVGLEHRQTINHFQSPPWQLSTPHKEQISTFVPGIAGWAEDIDLERQCSLTLPASYQANYTIYTDGSAKGWTRNEGAAAVVTRGSPIQPEVVNTIKIKGRTFTNSYEEEAVATESALTWTSTNANIFLLPSSFAVTVNHYVKLSYHQILVPLQFTILLTPSLFPFSFNGSLAILPFQVTN